MKPSYERSHHRDDAKYDEIHRILDRDGWIAPGQHAHLRIQLAHLQRTRQLLALCPGHLVRRERVGDIDLLLRVISHWAPDAVLMNHAAARVSFDPTITVHQVVLATTMKRRAPKGIRFVRWKVPEDHIHITNGHRHTSAALTAIDLSRHDDGQAIADVLRIGAATLTDLRQALTDTPHRHGNRVRRAMIHASRGAPWSVAERDNHELLRQAGITGWESNLRVSLPGGRHGYLDVAFAELKVGIEIDGREHHEEGEWIQFERDRFKQSSLVAEGWRILRFTWWQLQHQRDWVLACVRATLARSTGEEGLTLAA